MKPTLAIFLVIYGVYVIRIWFAANKAWDACFPTKRVQNECRGDANETN